MLNHSAISFSADSTESDPWQMFRPISMQKSPLIVPGFESACRKMFDFKRYIVFADKYYMDISELQSKDT